jgi:hypothetical protein
VNDAVTNPDKSPVVVCHTKPTGEHLNSGSPIVDSFVELFVNDLFAITFLNDEPRRGPDSFDLSPRFDAPLGAIILLIETEL